MITMFYDTETTGFVDFRGALDSDKQPDLMQIALLLFNNDERIAHAKFVVRCRQEPTPDAAKAHGLTLQKCLDEGMPARWAASVWRGFVKRSDLVVCHNVKFDKMVMRVLLHKSGIGWPDMKTLCTMEALKEFVGEQFDNGNYKWPKLTKLHEKLFGAEHDSQHDALGDVEATARCYFEAKKRGLL